MPSDPWVEQGWWGVATEHRTRHDHKPQRLVRFDGKIQVEPAQPSVKAAQDNIVPLRVHRLRPEATTASHLKSTAWSLAQAC
eukprot:m.868350 g.868350  ORF g.868350 m.868350 type:complete len:82 (+) comp23562_c0_seq2:568-813(+)